MALTEAGEDPERGECEEEEPLNPGLAQPVYEARNTS